MKLARDTWLIFVRNVQKTIREPVWVVFGLFQPVCLLLLFAPLLGSLENAPGFPEGGALNVFVPGVIVLMGMFGSGFVGFGLISELRDGLVERLRVTPVSRLALLLGRTLRDLLNLIVQTLLLVLVAIPLGLEVNLAGLAVAMGILAAIGLGISSCSYALALILKSEDAMAPVLNTILLPLTLLSGIYLPLTFAPEWLQNFALINPLSYAVEATRALFNGDLGDAAVFQGFAILVPLMAAALWWASRAFRKAVA